MKPDEMLKCLDAVADYMDKKDESPLCAKDLRLIKKELEHCWVKLTHYKNKLPIYMVE